MTSMNERVLRRFMWATIGTPWKAYFDRLLTEHAAEVRKSLKRWVEYYADKHESLDVGTFFSENIGEIADIIFSDDGLGEAITTVTSDILENNPYAGQIWGDRIDVQVGRQGIEVRGLTSEGDDYSLDVEVPYEAEQGVRYIEGKLKTSGATGIWVDFLFKRSPNSSQQKRLVFQFRFTVPFTADELLPLARKLFSDDVVQLAEAIPAENWHKAPPKVELPTPTRKRRQRK